MLFKNALMAAFVAFTVCVSAAPTPQKGGVKAPAKPVAKPAAPAKPAAKRKIATKKVKARGDKVLAAVPRALEDDFEDFLARGDFDEDFEDFLHRRELEDQWSDLVARANPTAKNPMTFYRAVTDGVVDESIELIGQSPKSYRTVKGDFSTDGGFYMYSDKGSAELTAAEKLGMGAKRAAVLTLTWTPPAGLKLKRWDAVDDTWREFTATCNKGGARPKMQTDYDFFEGPMSTLKAGKREQHGTYFQYVIPSNAFEKLKGNVKIADVTEILKE